MRHQVNNGGELPLRRRPCNIGNRGSGAHLILNARKDRDGVALSDATEGALNRPASLNILCRVSKRTNDGNLLKGPAEGQRAIVVFQKHHRSRGQFAFRRKPFRAVQGCFYCRLIYVGVIEQTELILNSQDGQYGGVDLLFRQLAIGDELGEVVGIGEARHVHVDAGSQSLEGRIRVILGIAVGYETADGHSVRHNEALESPFPAQYVRQQPVIAAGGHVVQVHVGRHKMPTPCCSAA